MDGSIDIHRVHSWLLRPRDTKMNKASPRDKETISVCDTQRVTLVSNSRYHWALGIPCAFFFLPRFILTTTPFYFHVMQEKLVHRE